MSADSSASESQAVLQFFKRDYGVIYVASGDGTSGFHSMLVYEPKSKTTLVLYTNIFGLFTEKETMLDIVDNIILEL